MLLVRHGESEFNVVFSATRVDPGICDPRLTEQGRRQAALAAPALREAGVRRLVSSPYTRALETATIIADALGLAVSIEPLVRERAAFVCDVGSPRGELARRFPHLRFDHLDDVWWHDHVGRGVAETEDELNARMLAFRQTMAAAPDWPHVAVVTHWGFIRALTGRPVSNCEVVRVNLSD
ncbi:MAG: histidine phosphatase family protein [Rhodospirillales bacterium]|nr:histidine phosphatase family protein [Rhodospirillales bacterium]